MTSAKTGSWDLSIECGACAADNAIGLSQVARPAVCGRCGATLNSGALMRIARFIAEARYSLLAALLLSAAVYVLVPKNSSPHSLGSISGGSVGGRADGRASDESGTDYPGAATDASQSVQATERPSSIAGPGDVENRAPTVPEAALAPAQGVFRYYGTEPRVAPLRIKTAYGPENYFIKVVDASDARPIITFFVKGGETYEARVPLGEVRVKYASGETWFGENALFGPETRYSQADHVFAFERTASGLSGYTIELIKQVDGNLTTKSIDRSQF